MSKQDFIEITIIFLVIPLVFTIVYRLLVYNF